MLSILLWIPHNSQKSCYCTLKEPYMLYILSDQLLGTDCTCRKKSLMSGDSVYTTLDFTILDGLNVKKLSPCLHIDKSDP